MSRQSPDTLAPRKSRKNRRNRTRGTLPRLFAAGLVLGGVLALGSVATGPLVAQEAPARPGPRQGAIDQFFFPPELIMEHQKAIGLDDVQRKAVIGEIQQLQSDMVPMQFEVHEAQEQLARLLDLPRVDEGEVIAQARQIMSLETRVRVRHLQLLIRLKNLLTGEHQSQLQGLRR